jgi:prepilin-type N-terminal cleavage/methylation domain-containing protein
MRSRRGFTLIEIMVVMVIVTILLAMAVRITAGIRDATVRSTTAAKLAGVDVALTNFVMVSRRLPCPADGALPATDANAGRELRTDGVNCDNNQARGVVPWVTLGIPEIAGTDGYDTRITYRVTPTAAKDEGMNFTSCDTVGSASAADTPSGCGACVNMGTGVPIGCVSPATAIAGKGLEIRTVGNTVVAGPASNTGAAYVLVSHGENRGGGYGPSGVLQGESVASGSGELQNVANAALQSFYVDDEASLAAAPAHFDDIVSRPTLLTVAQRAALSPRMHQPCPNPSPPGPCPPPP